MVTAGEIAFIWLFTCVTPHMYFQLVFVCCCLAAEMALVQFVVQMCLTMTIERAFTGIDVATDFAPPAFVTGMTEIMGFDLANRREWLALQVPRTIGPTTIEAF